jgi:chemotaxis protein MotB
VSSPRHVERRVVADVDNEERWLLTYSDMITLLLALFVVLFSLSTINHAKFVEFETGVRKALSSTVSPMPAGNHGLLSEPSLARNPSIRSIETLVHDTTAPPVTTNDLEELDEEIHAALAERGLLRAVAITLAPTNLKIRIIADRTFFATNSDALSPTGEAVVDAIGSVLARDGNSIVVDGFTDSTPVTGGPYYSNYLLSAARAVEVVERLVRYDGVREDRLYAVAYGSTHAAASNATAAGRARNRRVDIVILGGGES